MNERIINDITNFIFISDELKVADAIFLPGGSYAEIPEKGAELYRRGVAPIIVPSGRYSIGSGSFSGVKSKAHIYRKSYSTECDFYTDVLSHAAIPISSILRENRAEYTKQNADFSRALCDRNGVHPRSAIIVCKSFHARRCLMYYGFAFPETKLIICPVDCNGINRENWYRSKEAFDVVMGEVKKCSDQLHSEFWEYLSKN